MNHPIVKILKRILLNVLYTLALPVALFFVTIFTMMLPPYLQHTAIGLAVPLALLGYLVINDCWKQKWMRYVLIGYGALTAGFAVYVGVCIYHDSIPTVDDRRVMLSAYHPFEEDTKAVMLPESSTLELSLEDALSLRIDGATALYPVYASFARSVFEPSSDYYDLGEDDAFTLDCNGTTAAYRNLIRGDVDVIFCAQPSRQQLADAAEAGLTLHLTPIGREAFVFFVNSRNPVTNLTVEQVQGIYTGEITNWKQLGGPNRAIRAYQRAEGSGSQTALQSLMAGLPLMAAPREDVVADMGGIISQVASYRNYAGAIGFTFRFYSNEMVANDQIRLLSLNGVAPTVETIRSGEYPITSFFYAVTASPIGEPATEETNPILGAFINWCTGEQGQYLVEKAGYVQAE